MWDARVPGGEVIGALNTDLGDLCDDIYAVQFVRLCQIGTAGIVPLSVAFLENADQNIRLKGVWHSPASNGPWYGDPRVVDYWSTFLT